MKEIYISDCPIWHEPFVYHEDRLSEFTSEYLEFPKSKFQPKFFNRRLLLMVLLFFWFFVSQGSGEFMQVIFMGYIVVYLNLKTWTNIPRLKYTFYLRDSFLLVVIREILVSTDTCCWLRGDSLDAT